MGKAFGEAWEGNKDGTTTGPCVISIGAWAHSPQEGSISVVCTY